MKLINSCSNPIRVGSVICVPGISTMVPKEDVEAFLKLKSGKSLYDLFLKEDKPPEDKPVVEFVDDKSKPSKPSKPFLFDPKKHKVSHRGGGKWFIMEGDEKIKGPLTPEEKIIFQEMEPNDDD